ncbi:MAG TPA: N-acetyltransferase [Candidatus Paceibacterota bacterium]|nr:N-acetyltransferase [Candidatus Paceibacterota bacterium]
MPFQHKLAHSHELSPGTLLLPDELSALDFVNSLSSDYPELEIWFRTKVVPGLRAGTRKIVRIERSATLIGIGIAKKEDEKKICTVRIAPPYFGRGYALKIFDECLRWLGTAKPYLTVSENKLPAFERIFDYYGFVHTSSQLGRYRTGVIELAYNE